MLMGRRPEQLPSWLGSPLTTACRYGLHSRQAPAKQNLLGIMGDGPPAMLPDGAHTISGLL